MMPWWAWLVVSWLAGCALALLWWVTHIGRRPNIDMARLTEDLQPSAGEVESATVRYTVDPSKLSNGEWQALHDVMAADQASMRYAVPNPYPANRDSE